MDEAIRKHKVKSKAGDVDLPANFEGGTDEQKKQFDAFFEVAVGWRHPSMTIFVCTLLRQNDSRGR